MSNTAPAQVRNPGPRWGYAFLRLADRVLPEAIYRPARAIGTWIALLFMPAQRRHSRDYLRIIFKREPTWTELFRHFFALEEMLMAKLRTAEGRPHRGVLAADATDFQAYIESGEPAFLGTFHLAHSDLTGFLFGGQEHRRVAIIRQRVGNSEDTDLLRTRFTQWIKFIWVNQDDNLLFALKDAVNDGWSIAMKCDRVEFSAKTEYFQFLGARRCFPFTIYHLALIFNRPVLLSMGLPIDAEITRIESSPAWRPLPGQSRSENLVRAREHFQAFLQRVESVLHEHPYWWFNFLPLNPEESAA